jgi:hypothetical protein
VNDSYGWIWNKSANQFTYLHFHKFFLIQSLNFPMLAYCCGGLLRLGILPLILVRLEARLILFSWRLGHFLMEYADMFGLGHFLFSKEKSHYLFDGMRFESPFTHPHSTHIYKTPLYIILRGITQLVRL